MLDHYNALYPLEQGQKPSLLFLVGETRRDIIPRTLMDSSLGSRRIDVEEIVVYETGVMGSFEGDFGDIIRQKEKGEGAIWVVVFSPTGCEAMLRVLGLGPFARSGVKEKEKVFVATIGPTTRDYLRETFGFEAHVCAPTPSPEGVFGGIERFRAGL
jgi:uroporphyrinogen-III synthase